MPAIHFDNSYAALGDTFSAPQSPTPVAKPSLIACNDSLARSLGIDPAWLGGDEGIACLAGNRIPEGATPIASVYAGHQFGGFNPQLGDGRAVLLGEVISPDHQRYDLQLKGAGPTPWSRGGDGRSPLGPVLREYLISEAMHARSIPTTRALAAVTTGETVYRDTTLPGAILARVASSHIRVGTFEYFAARSDTGALKTLCEHVIQRHYPEAATTDNPILSLLQAVIRQQASLVAKWQLLGFIHGVMNTDNMLVCGETVDYGPCAFMDNFRVDQVYSSIDHGGRYAYRNQPGIAQWNLARLAQSLMPLLHEDQDTALSLAQSAIDGYQTAFAEHHSSGLQCKLGLTASSDVGETNERLYDDLWEIMQAESLDFTLTFRRLTEMALSDDSHQAQKLGDSVGGLIDFGPAMEDWVSRWQSRREREPDIAASARGMLEANPVYIPRNHLVEAVINEATSSGDFASFHTLLAQVTGPQCYDVGYARYASGPPPDEVVQRTFCGT